MPIPLLAAAGRAIMTAVRPAAAGAGRAGAQGAQKGMMPELPGAKPPGGGPGPRGPNDITRPGEKKAGGNSPGDILGNTLDVVNIGSTAASFLPDGQKPQQTPPADAPSHGKKINFDT